MNTEQLILSLIAAFAELFASLARSGEDKARQEEALMAAEERLSRIRAKQKFG